MRKTVAITAAVAASIAVGTIAAIAGTYSVWGHTFTYDEFRPQTFDVTVATDRTTGHKMNLIRMKNGHMMALVPADRYIGLMNTPEDDMVQ